MMRLFLISALIIVFAPLARAEDIAHDFTGSYALVIGIDKYQKPQWPLLKNGTADAEAMAAFLKAQGFEVKTLLNEEATRANILGYFRTYLRQKLTGDARVLFYFSGHGHTEKYGGKDIGYIAPYDGDDSATLISMDELLDESARLDKARHQLFILNSCFGGLIGTLRDGGVNPYRPDYLTQILKRPAREFITAGGADQSVVDGGPGGLSWFTYYFLEAARDGGADWNGKGVITFADLSSYLIVRAANHYQTPAAGTLPGDAGGQFVFAANAAEIPAHAPDASCNDTNIFSPACTPTHAPLLLASAEPPRHPPPTFLPHGLTADNIGALTRSSDLAAVAPQVEAMQQPIDNLYRAWEKLDFSLYAQQWSPQALQYSNKIHRTLPDILAVRKKDFARLASVTVNRYQLFYKGYAEGAGTFDAEYEMTFHYHDGHSVHEHERESYTVARQQDRWLIRENHDYIR